MNKDGMIDMIDNIQCVYIYIYTQIDMTLYIYM